MRCVILRLDASFLITFDPKVIGRARADADSLVAGKRRRNKKGRRASSGLARKMRRGKLLYTYLHTCAVFERAAEGRATAICGRTVARKRACRLGTGMRRCGASARTRSRAKRSRRSDSRRAYILRPVVVAARSTSSFSPTRGEIFPREGGKPNVDGSRR